MQQFPSALMRRGPFGAGAAIAAALVLAAPAAADAQTCDVPATYATIQSAINDPGCATVAIAPGVYHENLFVYRSVALAGAGAATTILDGSAVFTVVYIYAPSHAVSLSDLTVQNGAASMGGGINNYGATVTITDSVVQLNTGYFHGGGIRNEAALMTIVRSRITNNYMPFNDGAGIRNFGHLHISDSEITGNFTYGWGGGIAHSGQLVITNTTFEGNSAGWGGAIGADGPVDLQFVTMAQNMADYNGAAIWQSSTFRTKNSIIADNWNSPEFWFGSTVDTAGANFTTTPLAGATTVTMADLALGPMAFNGGTTGTRALLEGSVAIDASTDCTAWNGAAINTDQRGSARPLGAGCDAGAYEAVPPAPPTPAELVAGLADIVASLGLPAGQAGPLYESLRAAIVSLENGNTSAARGQLGAFKNKVSAMVKSRRLGAATGQALTAAADGILGTL